MCCYLSSHSHTHIYTLRTLLPVEIHGTVLQIKYYDMAVLTTLHKLEFCTTNGPKIRELGLNSYLDSDLLKCLVPRWFGFQRFRKGLNRNWSRQAVDWKMVAISARKLKNWWTAQFLAWGFDCMKSGLILIVHSIYMICNGNKIIVFCFRNTIHRILTPWRV